MSKSTSNWHIHTNKNGTCIIDNKITNEYLSNNNKSSQANDDIMNKRSRSTPPSVTWVSNSRSTGSLKTTVPYMHTPRKHYVLKLDKILNEFFNMCLDLNELCRFMDIPRFMPKTFGQTLSTASTANLKYLDIIP